MMHQRLKIPSSFTVAAIALAACGGTSSSPSATPGGVLPAPAALPTPIVLVEGEVLGTPTFPQGDTASGAQNGAPSSDGLTCNSGSGPLALHHHVHLSLYMSGNRVAIPAAIGMDNPVPAVNGIVSGGTCDYDLHTHDASGIIHVESTSIAQFTLGEFFDIWGEPLSATNIAGDSAATMIFTAQDSGNGTAGPAFTQYAGDPNAIPLLQHEEIVLEVGAPFVAPPQIPSVTFPSGF